MTTEKQICREKGPSQRPFPKENSILTRNGIETEPTVITDWRHTTWLIYGKDAEIFRVHTPSRLVNRYRPLEGSHGLHMQVDAV